MKKIIVSTFISMDGVLHAPGGPEEDRSHQFKWGGWVFPYWDDLMDNAMGKIMSKPFDLLLGRRTYEIFAAHWPYQENDPIGDTFNRIQKYVVATTPVDLSWQNSTLIKGDVVAELKKLKAQDGPDLLVHGSSRLVQTLLSHHLIDELHPWTFPLTLGNGKKLFEEGTQALEWKLTDSKISTTGVIIASYVPDGKVKTGSFVPDKVSKAEIARREKWAKEEQGK
ncbi:dihydrofolate reductase family protein [Pseudoflavitalea sp. X16]|uniref:dihydrofolate reductase family protein n=1 Tax=Paraflavitalea devenefica TaxID=2716334 RepID=UPI0014248EB8|nr:dihydrofolate reductase family protein [Paraflavitalea devenefica]NII26650.1 dihydrofolate reductase family protein [Paraflavitalea devenefica]